MQMIVRKSPNVHSILDAVDSAYAITSDKQGGGLIEPVFDTSFKPLFDKFRLFGNLRCNVSFTDIDYPPIQPFNHDNIILAFSGGKDSIAAAIKYKDAGYNVYLYHMKHINRSLSDEITVAQQSAELLGMPLYVDDISMHGRHMWMEHPMKNMIIANGALSYGIRNGIGTHIAFGNYTTSKLADNPFDRCAGDCMDMWEAYNAIIGRVIEGFKIDANLSTMGETLDIISEHPQLLDNSLSCLCRHSLRSYRNKWVHDKYGIQLGKYRCGSCYKCCVEYIYLADHDKIEFNSGYYKYCLNQLYRIARAEGWAYTIDDLEYLWDSFLFYPISESKLERIFDCYFLANSIRWLEDEGR